jgi:O-antigen ligase
VAGAATLLSPSPPLSLVGLYIEGTGFLFVAAVVGAWALGRGLRPPAARVLGSVVLAAGVANAVMCWLQMSSAFSNGMFDRVDGRAPGLLGNPVHATAFLVGAFALAVERAREPVGAARSSRIGYLAACALFASGVQLSGGRTGLLLLALVVVCGLFRTGRRTTLLVAAIAVAGVVLGSVAFPSDTGAAARLAGSDRGIATGRIDRWRTALPAIADRPVLGIGPGLYRRATSPHDTVAAAQAFGADRLYQDAHNLVVQYAVTTGVLGLAALAVWLALAAVGARGELAWFTVFAGLSLLVEPQFIGLTPVLALTLGAASPRPVPPATSVGRALVAAGLVVGLVAAALLLRGDVAFDGAARDRTVASAHRAERLLPMWPEPATFTARLASGRVRTSSGAAAASAADTAVRAARLAVRRDPSAPASYLLLAQLELDRGHRRAADRAFRAALRWNPESTAAFDGLAQLAASRHATDEVERWCTRYRAVVGRTRCP